MVGRLKKDIFLFALAFIFLVPFCSDADKLTVEQFLSGLSHKAQKRDKFSCNIIQKKKIELFDDPLIFKGKIFVDRDLGVRLDFFEPVVSSIIITEENMTRCYGDGKEDVISSSDSKVLKQIIQQIHAWYMLDLDSVSSNYTISLLEDNTSLKVLPKDSSVKKVIKAILIKFDKNEEFPKSIKISETNGDITEIYLSQCVTQTDLDPTLFTKCFLQKK